MNLALEHVLPEMNESPKTCSHQELLALDQTLAYTALANETLFHLLSNTTISSAIKLWLFIRTRQSGFEDRTHIAISVKQLSEALGVGRSTIQNWQRILIREGYLEVTERKSGMKSNLTNLYRACLPRSVARKISCNESRKPIKSAAAPIHGGDQRKPEKDSLSQRAAEPTKHKHVSQGPTDNKIRERKSQTWKGLR